MTNYLCHMFIYESNSSDTLIHIQRRIYSNILLKNVQTCSILSLFLQSIQSEQYKCLFHKIAFHHLKSQYILSALQCPHFLPVITTVTIFLRNRILSLFKTTFSCVKLVMKPGIPKIHDVYKMYTDHLSQSVKMQCFPTNN